MTEKDYAKVEIIEQIIGRLSACGETRSDSQTLKNLELAEEVVIRILESVVENAGYEGCEYSAQKIKEKSESMIKFIREITDGV